MVRTIIENVDIEVMSINLDWYKTFDRMNHHILEAVLFASELKLYFHSWVHLLYMSPGDMMEEDGVWLKT